MDGLVLPMVVLLVELGAGRPAAEASALATKALSDFLSLGDRQQAIKGQK